MTQTPTLAWDDLRLYAGAHGDTWRGQQSAVELSNLIAAKLIAPPPGLLRCDRPLEPAPFGDDHPSISRVIRGFVISLNDAWGDEPRQRLKPYAAKILCTATGPEAEERRAWAVTDWLVRRHTPAFLRLAGLDAHARALEGLARITDATLAAAAQPAIVAARRDAAAAWDAAAAAAAAEDARAAAEDARAAAADAAEYAAWAAAAAAAAAEDARAAAEDARVAAEYAAEYAAWDAAAAAAWAVAGDAAWVAARDALAPTVAALQDSALKLLDEMIALDEIAAVEHGEGAGGYAVRDVEQELIEFAWLNWISYDFRAAVKGRIPELFGVTSGEDRYFWAHYAIDILDSEKLRELFETVRERIGTYWESDGRVAYEKVAEAVTAADLKKVGVIVR